MSNVQYREVKRKATVGERIMIVNTKDSRWDNGEEFIVERVDLGGVMVKHSLGHFDGCAGVLHSEYAVLEPVSPAVTSAAAPQEPDALAAAFRQFVLDNADAIRAILPQVEGLYSPKEPQFTVGTGGGVTAKNVTVAVPKPLTRAEVIAKATADVAELLAQNHPGVGGEGAWFTDADGSTICDRAEFVVNREKRTVAALLRYVELGEEDDNKVWRKATAKAAPDDVFHAEIGKAIALRRALGLTVPSEYTDAPKPEEKRVGMRVVSEDKTFRLISPPAFPKNGEAHVGAFHGNNGKVIDDTDVDYDAVPAKEVA